LGAKIKRDWAKPRISPFGDSLVPLSHTIGTNYLKSWLYQYQGTMRPQACASWLKCPNYAAPVKPAKGGRVGDRGPFVTLINQHLVIARLLYSLMAPVSSSFPKYDLSFNIYAFIEGLSFMHSLCHNTQRENHATAQQ